MKKMIDFVKQLHTKARFALCTLLCAGLVVPVFDMGLQNTAEVPLPNNQISGVSSVLVDELAYAHPETERPGIYADREVLVIVPHQDDEVCILGGMFERYVAEGSRIRVLFTTNGDYSGADKANIRMQEAIDAMAIAGIPAEDILFLGYGDQWKNGHIYHSDGNTVYTSEGGYRETYNTAAHEVWEAGIPYTRNNYKAGLRDVLETLRPDTIFCIDFDGHQDHRALSLLFEEVMGEMLKDDPAYTPTVFKSFGYSLAWIAGFDFYEQNLPSTVNPTDASFMTEVNYYDWDARVRFPLAKEALSRIKSGTSTYQMLVAYASQEAPGQANRIINGDRTAWHRPTTSVLYRAAFSASSGDTSVLNDFRYIDCVDVTKPDAPLSEYVWIPDAADTEKTVAVTLESPTVLREIRLFDSRSLEHNVLKAEILLDNGAVYPVNDLPYNGSAAIVAIDETDPIGSFSVRILESEGENAGLSEIEAYKESPNHDIRYIKLMNESDDFVYDYWIEESGTETFALHGSNVNLDNAANDFTLTVEGDASCSARFDGNSIVVNCPAGAEMTLTIASKTDSTISDAVCISNPSAAWRTLVYMLQHYENLAGKLLPPQ